VTIRVALAEDHPSVRTGIRRILESSSDIDVIGEADNGKTAVEMVRKLQPDVLILDMELPELSGARVMEQIWLNRLTVRVLVLSSYEDKSFVNYMLGAGAAAYVMKREAPERLVAMVHKVASKRGHAPAARVYSAKTYEVA
jgi:DNA-binding NarL/FixJ family response regulator